MRAFHLAAGGIGLAIATQALAIETAEDRAQAYINEARAAITTVNARLMNKSIICGSLEAHEGEFGIAKVDGLMQGLVTNRRRFPPYMLPGVERALTNLAMEAGKLRLEQADGYLAAGCPAQADKLYRFVMTSFSSPMFDGIRQRAQVGIDDVRSRSQ